MTHDEIARNMMDAFAHYKGAGTSDMSAMRAALAVAGEMLAADLIEIMGTNGSYAVKRIRALTNPGKE